MITREELASKVNDLPELASRSQWAKYLDCDPATLSRYVLLGKLVEGHKTVSGGREWTKEQILAAFNISIKRREVAGARK